MKVIRDEETGELVKISDECYSLRQICLTRLTPFTTKIIVITNPFIGGNRWYKQVDTK